MLSAEELNALRQHLELQKECAQRIYVPTTFYDTYIQRINEELENQPINPTDLKEKE